MHINRNFDLNMLLSKEIKKFWVGKITDKPKNVGFHTAFGSSQAKLSSNSV